jgi:hypothetical protein
LASTREWESACWFYWTRSHHHQTDRDEGFRPGVSTDEVLLRADAGLFAGAGGGAAAACSVTTPAPAHWLSVLRRDRARVAELVGAVSIEIGGEEVRVGFAGDEAMAQGEPVLRSLLDSPAARVEIPEGKAGLVIGSGGENIKRLQGTNGIWAVNLESESSVLRRSARRLRWGRWSPM